MNNKTMNTGSESKEDTISDEMMLSKFREKKWPDVVDFSIRHFYMLCCNVTDVRNSVNSGEPLGCNFDYSLAKVKVAITNAVASDNYVDEFNEPSIEFLKHIDKYDNEPREFLKHAAIYIQAINDTNEPVDWVHPKPVGETTPEIK